MGKEYLANRGLSTDGNIYKAEDFQFLLHANLKINEKGEVDNKTNFEKTLSLEADNKNHKKLIEMLTALNDDQTDFNVFFSKYFDKSNYLTWLATSVLMGNRDTVNQNFALYQAAGSDKFYFCRGITMAHLVLKINPTSRPNKTCTANGNYPQAIGGGCHCTGAL